MVFSVHRFDTSYVQANFQPEYNKLKIFGTSQIWPLMKCSYSMYTKMAGFYFEFSLNSFNCRLFQY